MVVEPTPLAVTKPVSLFTVATFSLVLPQVTVLLVALAGSTDAVSVWTPPPIVMDSVDGVTVTPVTGTLTGAGFVTVRV